MPAKALPESGDAQKFVCPRPMVSPYATQMMVAITVPPAYALATGSTNGRSAVSEAPPAP